MRINLVLADEFVKYQTRKLIDGNDDADENEKNEDANQYLTPIVFPDDEAKCVEWSHPPKK